MKKLLAIGGVIIAVFILIIVLSNKSDEEKLKKNPYGKDNLEKSTIALIGNPNYSNIVLPEALFEKIDANRSVTVYYFSPNCGYCMEMTPVMMPIAKEMGVDVLQYNMLEFGDKVNEKTKYGIYEFPSLVHYENGKEVGRIVGGQPEDNIRAFFKEFEGK
ncbi:thioredoxin family protein [Sporosarcina limicola]|uniref:Thiol-disulfide isomerase/thioredoxin n=1 Tax=Sporosarcina limicola TaxID=34101 RepID=A0A927RD21_9BACL|nr:thioredoxin family protein [Sporosarcina limicola]MBE1554940.1 thiol-disulfide isomerase/thioredoxin [Sporosarcina limicola]